MMSKAIAVLLLMALSLTFFGCTTDVSQEEYDTLLAKLNTVLNELASLEGNCNATVAELDAIQDEIASLMEEIVNLEDPRVEEAWDRAQQRHMTIVQEFTFIDELEEMAPWIVFPDKPTWLDSTRLCSVILDDDPTDYDAVCIVTIGPLEMLVRLSDSGLMTTMTCRGGTVDYEITVARDLDGKIIQEMMTAGESSIVIDWTDNGIEATFTANVNGLIFESPWSEDENDALALFSELSTWLDGIDMDGGLIKPPDQPLVIIGLGELRQPPYDTLNCDALEVLQRLVSDFMEGVPQTCM